VDILRCQLGHCR